MTTLKSSPIIDQTRPDQTRPDQNYALNYWRKLHRKYSQKLNGSLRKILKKIDHFRLPSSCLRRTRCFFWNIERKIFTFINRHKTSKLTVIIQTPPSGTGFMSHFMRVLSVISYADRRGMIPVVDMRTNINAYLYKHEVGKINAWEYYFKQPGGVCVDDALSDSSAIFASPAYSYAKPNSSLGFYYNYGGELDYWRELCRKYLHFSDALNERLAHERHKFADKRVLGVSVRGTDYVALRNTNHSVQPNAEQIIAKVREVLAAENFDAVYLSTEDQGIISEFRKYFAGKLILPEQEYFDFDTSNWVAISEYTHDRLNDKFLNGLEYLASKLLLCECQGLVTSMSGGAVLTMLFSHGFEYLYVFDLGVYP